jgi:hypothetical protein
MISAGAADCGSSSRIAANRTTTALAVYRRLLDLLWESGLSKQEKIEVLDRAANFI